LLFEPNLIENISNYKINMDIFNSDKLFGSEKIYFDDWYSYTYVYYDKWDERELTFSSGNLVNEPISKEFLGYPKKDLNLVRGAERLQDIPFPEIPRLNRCKRIFQILCKDNDNNLFWVNYKYKSKYQKVEIEEVWKYLSELL
jgi:hypothetical protein